jgi:DNA-binding LacI/PurR family transcriptional regulator
MFGKVGPDGFVCANDFTAAHLLKTLNGLGVSVPDEVRMAGIDDVKYASLLSVPLTTIHQPCADIGAVAVRTMIERLRNPTIPPRDILLNFSLVVRESCGSRKTR